MTEISLAPMIKVTTPQFRLLIRKLSPNTLLFTEMIVDATVNHATTEKIEKILGKPDLLTVVQIGGSEPEKVAAAVKRLHSMGWTQFNLNCGCPSDRVQSGKFGAVLMKDAANVSSIINKVYESTGYILSLKIRTGVDELDSYEFFKEFVVHISSTSPCIKFYVHARKCWLSGLNPKQNRTIPPLNYQYVYDLKAALPHLSIYLNGGVRDDGLIKLQNLDGLMIGRYAVENIRVFCCYEEQLRELNTKNHEDTSVPLFNTSIKCAIQNYLYEARSFECSKSKILLPLNNILKGCTRNKEFRKILTDAIHSNMSLDDIFKLIEKYIP
ncbi:tRNA-dihydrouridine synthase A [Pancytospora epiphaga]|nr:tRNA-dihydrouridine synthase A [Pancytospora epiphaga]